MARRRFLTGRARLLRRGSTDAEKALWTHLRSRQLDGAKFRRQVEIDGYVVDFLCANHRLIIEVDGGQHTPERDAERTAYGGFRSSNLASISAVGLEAAFDPKLTVAQPFVGGFASSRIGSRFSIDWRRLSIASKLWR